MTTQDRETEQFLTEALPIVHAMDLALHNGDAGPRINVWSHNDPVTLFGALRTVSGWGEIEPVFERLASSFSKAASFEYEVLAAGASADLAYLVGFEHTVAAVGSAEPTRYDLRVTTIFRREDGRWRIIHRHADPLPGSAEADRQRGQLANALEPPSGGR